MGFEPTVVRHYTRISREHLKPLRHHTVEPHMPDDLIGVNPRNKHQPNLCTVLAFLRLTIALPCYGGYTALRKAVVMNIHEMLKTRKEELEASISGVMAELRDIDLALAAIGDSVKSDKEIKKPSKPKSGPSSTTRYAMPVDDAVVMAIAAGTSSPAAILEFLQTMLNIQTTINSVRTRLSKLKKSGLIANGEDGWVIDKSFEESASKAEGESAATPPPSVDLYSSQGHGV